MAHYYRPKFNLYGIERLKWALKVQKLILGLVEKKILENFVMVSK